MTPQNYAARATCDNSNNRSQAHATTTAKAENKLRDKLKDRSTAARKGELTAMHRFSAAAELWMSRLRSLVDSGERSAGTLRTYTIQLDKHVRPALGELRLGEVTTPLVDKFLGHIKTDVGPPTAKTCRSVVSGVMGLAVRYGAVTVNPVREADRIAAKSQEEPRELMAEEWAAWAKQLRADTKAVERDLPDLCLFMIGTGVRIGEALATLWHQVSFDAGEVEITHTIIRVKGVGLVRKSTKSRAGERVLKLPASLAAMLRSRFMVGVRLDDPVFPNTLGGFRDPNNTCRHIREARGKDLLPWVTSHNFRKTVATVLGDAGHSGRKVADQIGHSRVSITQDVYLGRKVANPKAAKDLEKFLDHPDPSRHPNEEDG